MRSKAELGRHGEAVAVAHLEKVGLKVLARNWRCPSGELDIVAVDGCCLVVVEVKTRSSLAFGHPAEAVNWAKSARLRRLTAQWLGDHAAEHGHLSSVRIDVVAVLCPAQGPALVQHLRSVG